MSKLWNRLKGKKTYLLCLCCIALIVLQALWGQLEGQPVPWPHVALELLACLTAMTLRHGIGARGQGSGGGCQGSGCPLTRVEEEQYRVFDR